MQKVFEWSTRRVIDYVPIMGDYVAYRERVYTGGGLPVETEGITIKQMIEKIELKEPVMAINTVLREGIKGKFALYKPAIREIVRTVLWGSEDFNKQCEEFLVLTPYTYFTDYGMEGVELLCLSWYDHNLYDINKVIQPRAMYFNYIDAHMNNRCYNLEEVVQVLEARDDIEWLDSRHPWEREYKGRIMKIPYYNTEEGYTHCIEFMWKPTEEDFAKVRPYMTNSHGRHDAVCREIFGLTKLASY